MPEGSAPGQRETVPKRRKKNLRIRPWLRAAHRDFGYVAVGLTFVYALSGLAVNHIADWDPNFVNYERQYTVDAALPGDERAAADVVLSEIDIEGEPLDVYAPDERQIEIVFDDRTLFVDRESKTVYEEGQRERPVLRAANWLHLNRGKKAWTWFADGYAIVLLFLATSGMFMLPGKKGLRGRGSVLVGLGIAIPLVYLVYFGSPS